MGGDEVWRVNELIDESHPFIQDVKLARQIVETINSLEGVEDHNVRIPRSAKEFAANTLTDWFELIAQIEKKRGNMPHLVDRNLYSVDDGAMNDIGWNHALTVTDIGKWFESDDFADRFHDEYPMFNKLRHTAEEPISGYINRLFPVKFALRVLASLTLSGFYDEENQRFDEDGTIELHDLRERCYSIAKYAKEYLKGLDLKIEPGSTTDVRVGFPEESEKAKERFVAQFIGSKRKDNVSGALFELGFANLAGFSLGPIKHTSSNVLFTKIGWDFMMLPNPLLDSIDSREGWDAYFETGVRFSDKEIQYLLSHIKQNIPSEWKLITNIAQIIHEGNDRPKSLEEKLVVIYNWDKTKASQMRNGALSRMEELCLIGRKKIGREVTYHLTDLCKSNVLS
tara:strand:- start:452 stop:1642 length:1191 start_codon:yes stop_codon:yes gene_type:complete